ncbi:MAG: LPS export ABC transporter periplasmic protein LptC [Proteobacteria bacterium]|nr:LPS export ABC transporter periplasmic protein LptC [Pseudomonadota bacterium]
MKISLRTYVSVFFVLALIFGYFSFQKTAQTVYTPPVQTVIDQSLKGIYATRFDESGQMIEVLTMKSWQHEQGQKHSQLEAPDLKIYQKNGEHWQICAKSGQSVQTQVYKKIESLQLSDDVTVIKVGTTPNSKWELKTQNMHYQPALSLATTTNPVFITGQGTNIQAIGMRANLKEQTINLLGNVKSHYVAPKA